MNGPRLRGAERFAVQLAEELAHAGVRQRIVFLKGLEMELPEIPYCDYIARQPGMSFLAARKWLREQLTSNEGHIAICHGQGPQKEVLSAVALSGRHRPYVVVKQIGMIMPWLTRLVAPRKRLNSVLFKMTDLCVCLGPKQAAELRNEFGVPEKKIVIIPNGRRMPRHQIVDGEHAGREVLVVGALTPEKNPDLALTLFAEVRKYRPDLMLTFVGDGHMRSELEERAASVFPKGTVRFEGQVANVWPYYERAEILLLCSQTEGVPGVVIEACYAGLPTVAWDVGDIATVLDDDINGRLTPFEEREALAAALISVALDKHTRQRLGAGALEISARFHMDKIAAAYIETLSL